MGEAGFRLWTDFYVIMGSASAALTGLVFVVMTLVANRAGETGDEGPSHEGTSVYSTPTVVLFGTAFFVSCIAVIPYPWLRVAGTLIGLIGLFGIVYIARTSMRGLRLEGYDADAEDRVWFMVLPVCAYVALTIGGFLMYVDRSDAPFLIALSLMLAVLIGIRNAWDVCTYLAIRRPDR